MAISGKTSITAAAFAMVALIVTLSQPTDAFLRIMGNADTYCGVHGSYCYSESDCCAGLSCSYGYKRYGGVCGRESPNYGISLPSLPSMRECQADGDCPAGQCCISTPLGVRGGSLRSCRSQCPDKDVEAILGDFYSRYYRSAYYRRRRRGAASLID